MSFRSLLLTISPFLVAAGPCATTSRGADAMEAGFAVESYLDGLNEPTAMQFDPEGRLFVAEKSGKVRIAMRGQLRDEPAIELPLYDFFECGLSGMALDPNYDVTPYLYICANVSANEQQIIRYRIVNGRGVEQTVIRGNIPSGGTIHNGGCLRFGPDGMLYFSVGDNGTSDNAQSHNTLAGKVCRITPTGETPADNPFTTGTGSRSAIFALGFRNPFRFCFMSDGRLFLADVGSFGESRREEINLVRSGLNYGWPTKEGAESDTSNDGFEPPIYDYSIDGQCIAGILSYKGANFPTAYRDNLFYLDYTLSRVFRIQLEGDEVANQSLFAQAEGSTVDLSEGPDGRIYYCEITTGEVKRIGYSANNTPEPGADLAEDDWGGDTVGGNENDNANANDNTSGNGPNGSIFDILCGAGAATTSLIPLAAVILIGRPLRKRRSARHSG